jgi:hypothetical protein
MKLDPYDVDFQIGDKVYDDLTREDSVILGISYDGKALTKGYWIDSYYLDGGRFPWEITKYVENDEE